MLTLIKWVYSCMSKSIRGWWGKTCLHQKVFTLITYCVAILMIISTHIEMQFTQLAMLPKSISTEKRKNHKFVVTIQANGGQCQGRGPNLQ